MTEEEARTKWCPMASSRVVTRKRDDGSVQQAHYSLKACRDVETACIASDCMMWVWDRELAKVNGGWVHDAQLDNGHCGLCTNS